MCRILRRAFRRVNSIFAHEPTRLEFSNSSNGWNWRVASDVFLLLRIWLIYAVETTGPPTFHAPLSYLCQVDGALLHAISGSELPAYEPNSNDLEY